MLNLISYSLNFKDEPILQQLQTYLQHLSFDKRAAIAIAALFEATEPSAIYFDYNCECSSKFNQSIALLQKLSTAGN